MCEKYFFGLLYNIFLCFYYQPPTFRMDSKRKYKTRTEGLMNDESFTLPSGVSWFIFYYKNQLSKT